MTFWLLAFTAMILIGLLMICGAFGTWGFNERLGVITIVAGIFLFLAGFVIANKNMHDACAEQGGIILEFTYVDPAAIIVL